MKKIFTLVLMLFVAHSASAFEIPLSKDSTKNEKYKFFIKGRIDTYAFFDSHTTLGAANGLTYSGPTMPDYEYGTLNDLNNAAQLRYSIGASRIGGGGSIQFSEKNSVDAYVEVDFTNQDSGSAFIGIRLRHAYARLNLGNSSILFGQTSHLSMYDEIAPGLVQFGGGFPFNTLSRPVQFRFSQRFSGNMSLDVALSMSDGSEYQQQAFAMTPDLTARFTVGNPKGHTLAVFAGFKSIKPGLTTYVSDEDARMNAFYGGITGQVVAPDALAVSGALFYGGDLSSVGMIGGYAASADLSGYSAINTLSAWLNVTTMRYNGFEFGAFVGYQANMGTMSAIDEDSVVALGAAAGVDNYWMVGPRAWYHYNMLSFGLEYMYGESTWMEGYNDQYQSSGATYPPTSNNRVTLLARFTF